MKLILLLLLFVGCAQICPVKEMTYIEKMESYTRLKIKGEIDKKKNLNKRQKFLAFEFTKCARDLIPNPFTIRHLMKWQNEFINNTTSHRCLRQLRSEYGDITELLKVLH